MYDDEINFITMPKRTTVSVRLDESMYVALNSLAKRTDNTISRVLRLCIKDLLAEAKSK